MAARRSASLYRVLLLRSPPARRPSGSMASLLPDFQASRYQTWKRYSTFNPACLIKVDDFRSAICTSAQKRLFSQAAARSEVGNREIGIGPITGENEEDGKDIGVLYQGPISSTIKKVKLLSLSTCCLSVSLGPVITFMTSPDMNVILKGAVASILIFFSASTTAVLHWFVSPYIHKLKWQPGSDSFKVELMSWLATPIFKTIKFSEVMPPETNRPFVTFSADGNFYFIDVMHCHNKALLARLTPQKQAHKSAFKNL